MDLAGLRRRRPHAVERWFLRYADAVYTFVFYRVGKDQDLATDVVQETFMTALCRIEDFDPQRGSMLAWLTYVARNCIRAALTGSGRYKRLGEYWEEIDEKLLAAYRELDSAPLPEDVLARQETAELVHMALSNIPDHYQRALTQRYYRQQLVAEIACSEGMSEGAAKSLLHRARLAFKTAFQSIAETTDAGHPVREAIR